MAMGTGPGQEVSWVILVLGHGMGYVTLRIKSLP